MRINLFNKTAIRCKGNLDSRPEARAGLRQEHPGEGPHHLLHLLDQIIGFVTKLFNDQLFRDATHKIVKRLAVRRARRPDLLHPHLCKSLLDPVLHPVAVLGRSAILMADVIVISSYVSASFDIILSYLFWKCVISCAGGEGGRPAEVPGDELVEVGGQDGSLSSY